MKQLELVPPVVQHFDGKTYDPRFDHDRLAKQLGRVYEVLSDGHWWRLGAIQWAISNRYGVRDSESGISARLRDLRKPKFGGHEVERRRVKGGTWEYRLVEFDACG